MRKSKYNNCWVYCLSKHHHQSKKEADRCNSLLADLKNGKLYKVEIQVKVPLKVNEKLICHIIIDFLVFDTPLRYHVEEVKSKATKTAAWSIKHKLFKALYPSVEYRLIE